MSPKMLGERIAALHPAPAARLSRRFAADHGQVLPLVEGRAVDVQGDPAPRLGVHEPSRDTKRRNQRLVGQTVLDELGDGEDGEGRGVLAKRSERSAMRAIEPSSFMISQMTPAGVRPAR